MNFDSLFLGGCKPPNALKQSEFKESKVNYGKIRVTIPLLHLVGGLFCWGVVALGVFWFVFGVLVGWLVGCCWGGCFLVCLVFSLFFSEIQTWNL